MFILPGAIQSQSTTFPTTIILIAQLHLATDRPVDSVSSNTPGNLIRPSRATLTLENSGLPPCVPWKFLFLPPNRPLHQWIYFWGHPCCRCLPEGDTHSLGSSVVTGEAGPTLVSALVSPFVRLLWSLSSHVCAFVNPESLNAFVSCGFACPKERWL